MTNHFFLDSTIMAISLINTILLIWLGLTVLLNAERRTWGAWLAGSGLLLGGIFFISHTAILGYGFSLFGIGLDIWWRLGLAPVVALPFVWYLMMLWYSGFWGEKTNLLSRRQMPWFIIASITTFITLGLIAFENPVPSFIEYANEGLLETATIGGIPLLILFYPFYAILCVSLALDALRNPGPTDRVMGDLARERARPWLIATSIVLLMVSFLVAITLVWIYIHTGNPGDLLRGSITIGILDLAIETLIGISVILLGQAIVAYEIFTGKTLPRYGFLRYWRRAIILAVGYGIVIGVTANTNLRPIYNLLLTALLMTSFYAMLGWRSYTERERYIDNLRPFIASHGFFDQLTTTSHLSPTDLNLQEPFNALCSDVLDAKVAFLIPFGSMAPLVGAPIVYPAGNQLSISGITDLLDNFTRSGSTKSQITPTGLSEAPWAVPLWSERGIIGILFLGDKRDGGLYTQEEIEIAQTSGERLIDTKASVEIAHRLMALQRQRLAESQLLDQRARRVLHDDVLQQLHTAMLKLVSEKSRPNGGTSEAIELLAEVHNQISDLLRDMPTTSLPEITKLGLIGALQKLINEEYGSVFETVSWKIDHEAERYTQSISPLKAEVLYYASRESIRNAAKHGMSEYLVHPLHLNIRILVNHGLEIQIEDDGVGMSEERIITESEGQGLALHSTMMAVVGGELTVDSEPGEYTRVSLLLPVNT
jgi:signal transduction histidine kinase